MRPGKKKEKHLGYPSLADAVARAPATISAREKQSSDWELKAVRGMVFRGQLRAFPRRDPVSEHFTTRAGAHMPHRRCGQH